MKNLILIFLVLNPYVAMAKEIINLRIGLVMRECSFNSSKEKVCLGSFDNARPIEIELSEGDWIQSGNWEKDYKIGSETFTAHVGVVKVMSTKNYGITLFIKGKNFNPKSTILVKSVDDISNVLGFEVKDDSLFIKDNVGTEYSPVLYLN